MQHASVDQRRLAGSRGTDNSQEATAVFEETNERFRLVLASKEESSLILLKGEQPWIRRILPRGSGRGPEDFLEVFTVDGVQRIRQLSQPVAVGQPVPDT